MDDKILHVIIFKVAENVNSERIEKVKGMFLSLMKTIPGIEWIKWEKNLSNSKFAADWKEGCLMLFTSSTDRDNFLIHPDHKAISNETGNGFYTDLIVYDLAYNL